MMSMITWLHLSDLHFSSKRDYNANLVLSSLLADIKHLKHEGQLEPSFIAVTGDIGLTGKAEEYELAKPFFDELLTITELDKNTLFLVPGNHDANWSVASSSVLDKALSIDKGTVSQFLTNEEERRIIFEKFHSYSDFVNSYFSEQLPFDSTNYSYVKFLNIAEKHVAILGLNTAWLSGPNPYRNVPLLGEKQVHDAIALAKDADIRIAIMHHSPASLGEFDQERALQLLLNKCHFILHGHVHRADVLSLLSPDSEATVIGAGAMYETREFANSYNLVRLDFVTSTGEIHLRRFSDARGGFWAPDTITYRNVLDGTFSFLLSSQIAPSRPLPTVERPRDLSSRIVIMHLSDLQFGRHHTDLSDREPLYRDDKSYENELAKIKADLKRVKDAYGITPDFIVATGDIAEWSLEVEYEAAKRFLQGLTNACGIPHHHVLIVPGNHDVNRKLCQAERLTSEALGVEFKIPYFEKFRLYQEFFNNFYRPPTGVESLSDSHFEFTEDLFVIFPYPKYGVIFAGLNSCVRESDLDEDHYGWISIDQLRRAIRVCDLKDPDRALLRIALLHHNFRRDSFNDSENLRDADELETPLLDAGFKLVLHGHQHTPKVTMSGVPGKPLHILATGSAGLDSDTLPENARRYQYLAINGHHVDVYRRRFEVQSMDNTGKGSWVPDPLPEDSPLFQGGPATLSFDL